MSARLPIIASIFILLAAAWPARAEVQVSAQVDRTALSPGESLQLKVTIDGDDGEVDTAAITDFEVHPRGSSSSLQIVNTRMSKQVTYHYLLLPLRKGRLTIPALKVDVDGEVYHTDPVTVTVADRPATGSDVGNPDREVWVAAELSDSAPFQGQQLAYTFRLYNAVKIENAKFQPPEFTSFTAKEIKDRHSDRRIINGREYAVTELYYVLTPLEAGPHTIEPAVLQVGIVRPDPRRHRSPFDGFFDRGILEPRILKTEALDVTVRPLPPLQGTQKFSGLVGQFDLATEMETTALQVGDSATLTITLQGQGNIQDAPAPELALPAALKSYADNPEETVQLDRKGTKGKKVFRTALVPVEAGTFELPDIKMVYFDVAQRTYRTLSAKVPALKVSVSTNAQAAPVTITPEPLAPAKKKVTFTGHDILPPKERLTAIQSHEPVAWYLLLAALLAPALVFGCVAGLQRLKRPDPRPVAVMRAKARRALKHAQSASDDEFLTALYQAITAAIFAAAGRLGETLTWKEAEALLARRNLPQDTSARAVELLAKIESSKFGGARPDAQHIRELLDLTRKMVRKLIP